MFPCSNTCIYNGKIVDKKDTFGKLGITPNTALYIPAGASKTYGTPVEWIRGGPLCGCFHDY